MLTHEHNTQPSSDFLGPFATIPHEALSLTPTPAHQTFSPERLPGHVVVDFSLKLSEDWKNKVHPNDFKYPIDWDHVQDRVVKRVAESLITLMDTPTCQCTVEGEDGEGAVVCCLVFSPATQDLCGQLAEVLQLYGDGLEYSVLDPQNRKFVQLEAVDFTLQLEGDVCFSPEDWSSLQRTCYTALPQA